MKHILLLLTLFTIAAASPVRFCYHTTAADSALHQRATARAHAHYAKHLPPSAKQAKIHPNSLLEQLTAFRAIPFDTLATLALATNIDDAELFAKASYITARSNSEQREARRLLTIAALIALDSNGYKAPLDRWLAAPKANELQPMVDALDPKCHIEKAYNAMLTLRESEMDSAAVQKAMIALNRYIVKGKFTHDLCDYSALQQLKFLFTGREKEQLDLNKSILLLFLPYEEFTTYRGNPRIRPVHAKLTRWAVKEYPERANLHLYAASLSLTDSSDAQQFIDRITHLTSAIQLDSSLNRMAMNILLRLIGKLPAKEAATAIPHIEQVITTSSIDSSWSEWEKLQQLLVALYGSTKEHAKVIEAYKKLRVLPSWERNPHQGFAIPKAFFQLKRHQEAFDYLYKTWQCETVRPYYKYNWSLGSSMSWHSLFAKEFEKCREVEEHYSKTNGIFMAASSVHHKKNRAADSISYAMTLANIGHSWLFEEEHEKARSYYKRSMRLFEKFHKKGNKKAGASEFERLFIEDFGILKKHDMPMPATAEEVLKQL